MLVRQGMCEGKINISPSTLLACNHRACPQNSFLYKGNWPLYRGVWREKRQTGKWCLSFLNIDAVLILPLEYLLLPCNVNYFCAPTSWTTISCGRCDHCTSSSVR